MLAAEIVAAVIAAAVIAVTTVRWRAQVMRELRTIRRLLARGRGGP